MRRALTVLAGAVLALSPLGAATAQPADPQIVAVTAEKGCAFNGGPIGEQGLIVAPQGETASSTVQLPEDSFDGQGFVTLGVAYGPNTHRQPFLDLGLVVTDCAPPADTPTPTTSPAPTTAPPVETTTPPATLAPDPDDDDGGEFDQIGPGAVPSGGVATGG